MRRLPTLLALALALALPSSAQTGFWSTADGQILDPSGKPQIIKGVGLGGWLVPEGYMLHISAPDGGSPSSIRAQIVDLIGEHGADDFFELYRANYVAEADIEAIAGWGYDHVRLPFHFKDLWDPDTETFREEGFELFDTFLGWCRTHGLDVILDMHAAPGGQNDGNISDSGGEARLWTEPDPYQDWTVEIWTEIARRYADDPLIIGYDLINEPVLPQSVPSSDLRALYVRLTDAIRAVDPNHILFIEGNYYATDFGALETPWDANMVYAFHKYWNAPDQGSIQYLINLREATGVPLWLGETGENSNAWFSATRRLAEANNIGWNWWTHKKIESVNTPVRAVFAPGYEDVIRYWRGDGPRPSAEAARTGLMNMAAGLSLARSVRNVGVLEALFEDSFRTDPEPYRDHRIPGAIPAVMYDVGDQGAAYADSEPWADSGTPGSGNNGGAFRNDGVDIEASSDPEGHPYNVGWIEALERLRYTVTVDEAGVYDVEFRVASAGTGGQFSLLLDGATLGRVTPPGTGGWQAWQSVWLRGIELPAGEALLDLSVRRGGFNLNTMRFTRVGGVAAEERPEAGGLGLAVAPNPVAGAATATVRLVAPASVRVGVVDALGRRVQTLEAGRLGAGVHRVALPLGDLPAGVYAIRVEADAAVVTDRVTVVR